MNGKLTILVCILVAGVVVGASLPIFDSLTASSESIHNDGAGWVRFDLNKSADASYNINVSWDDDGYYIANGANVQTFNDSTTEDFNTIIYADSNVSVWTADGDSIYMLGTDAGAPVMATFTDPVSIARDSAGVVVSDGTDSYTFGAPAWAYVPQSSGVYGFFNYDEERGVNNPTGTPTAVIGGGFAGVYAYNDIYTYGGLGLTMHPIIDEETGLYYGAEWYKDNEPVNPDDITINPLDPSIINPGDSTQPVTPIIDDPGIDIIDPLEPDISIMSVPTPTYTDGNWGYDLMTVDGVNKAKIVSYSGSGGNIIVPATIGGYDVYMLGKDAYMSPVFDNASISANSTLTISEGIKVIGQYAVYGCANFTGALIFPSSLEIIKSYSFINCSNFTSLTLNDGLIEMGQNNFMRCTGFTGQLVIPSTLTAMGQNNFSGCTHFTSLDIRAQLTEIPPSSFNNCSGLTGQLVIPDSVTSIRNSAFGNCTGFTGQLVIPDSVTTIGSQAFINCRFTGQLVIPDSVTTIDNSAFYGCEYFSGPLVIPDSVTSIGSSTFAYVSYTDLVIPDSVTSIGSQAFQYYKNSCNNIIMASSAIPGNNAFFTYSSNTTIPEFLDLSDTVDYSVDRYGLRSDVIVSDSIGDTFGYIAVADLEGEGNGTIGDLIALLPVVMLAGIVLFAVVALAINRS